MQPTMQVLFNKIKANRTKLWVPVGQFAMALAGLLAYMLLTRKLGAEQFGYYIIFIAGTAFFDMLRRGLVRQGLVRFLVVVPNLSHRQKFIVAAWQIYMGFSFLASGLVAAVYYFVPSLLPNGFQTFGFWFPLAFGLMGPAQMMVFVAQAQKQFKKVAFFSVLQPLLFLLALGGVVWFQFKLTINVAATLFLLSHLVSSLVALVAKGGHFVLIFSLVPQQVKLLLTFGKFSMATLLGTNLLKSADVFMIGAWLGAAPAGLYAVGQKIIEVAEIPLRSAAVVFYPKMANFAANKVYFGAIAIKVAGLLSALVVPISLAGVFFPHQLITLLAGKEFILAAPVFVTMAFYTLLLPTDRTLGMAFDAANKPQFNTLKTLLMSAINVGGNAVAILVFGNIIAVAGVTIVTAIFGLVYGLVYFNKIISLGAVFSSFNNSVKLGVHSKAS